MERRNVLCWSLGTCVLSAVLSLPLAAQSAPSADYALENGDVNGDQERDLSDPVYLLGYLFSGSEEPVPLAFCGSEATVTANGDTNGDGTIDVSDPILLLGWLFSGGPAPVDACGEGAGGSRQWNPRVIPPVGRILKRVYAELSARWWQWAFSIPAAQNPVEDTTGQNAAAGQSGPVWFLGSTFGDLESPVERTFAIPAGKAIFMPVYQWIFGAGVFDCEPSIPGVPCDIPTLRAAAAAAATSVQKMEVSIDNVPVEDIRRYRAVSPDAFSVTFPPDAVFGFPPGTFSPHVADGYWLLLAPLSHGTHTINVHVVPDSNRGAEYRINYHVTVH